MVTFVGMNPTRPNPLFIAFEGIDGSGKSTHSRLLAEKMQALEVDHYRTFEPTDSEIGRMIRRIITGESESDPRTLAGLFVADRLNHILNPADGMLQYRALGKHLITDRYYFSSYAYHSLDMDMDWVIAANSLSASLLKPDVHFFIDVDPSICMQRIESGRGGLDLFENLDKLTAIRKNYLIAFDKLKSTENIVIIDGNRAMDLVAADITAWVNNKLKLNLK